MKSRPVVLLALATLIHMVSFTEAWYIDPSCTGSQVNFVRTAFIQAFTLARLGDVVVNAPSPPQRDLMHKLFGTNDTFTAQAVNNALGGVAGISTQHCNANQLQRNDVRIYCDQSRLKPRVKDPLHYYDPHIDETVNIDSKIDCKTGQVFAYTQRPLRTDRYDQIQICPWFLEYAMKDSYRFKNDIKADMLARMALKLNEFVTDKWYTPVDLIMLFDKVMLHELTHTRAGTETIDVGGRSGYGWKSCSALSTVVTNPTTKTYGPEKNADSYAIFASGCYIISQGLTINSDGSISEKAEQKRAAISWEA